MGKFWGELDESSARIQPQSYDCNFLTEAKKNKIVSLILGNLGIECKKGTQLCHLILFCPQNAAFTICSDNFISSYQK